MTSKFADGKALKERVQNILNGTPESDFQDLYNVLEEWQLLGLLLLILEWMEKE